MISENKVDAIAVPKVETLEDVQEIEYYLHKYNCPTNIVNPHIKSEYLVFNRNAFRCAKCKRNM